MISSPFFLSRISWFAVPNHRVQRCPAVPPRLLLQRRVHKIPGQRRRDHQRWGFISGGHAYRHPLGRFLLFSGLGGLFWWRGAWTSVWMCLLVLSHLGCVHGMRSGSTSSLFFIFLSNWLIWQMLLSKVTHDWAEPMKHFQFEPFLWNELLKNNPEECSDWKVLSLNTENWIANKGT